MPGWVVSLMPSRRVGVGSDPAHDGGEPVLPVRAGVAAAHARFGKRIDEPEPGEVHHRVAVVTLQQGVILPLRVLDLVRVADERDHASIDPRLSVTPCATAAPTSPLSNATNTTRYFFTILASLSAPRTVLPPGSDHLRGLQTGRARHTTACVAFAPISTDVTAATRSQVASDDRTFRSLTTGSIVARAAPDSARRRRSTAGERGSEPRVHARQGSSTPLGRGRSGGPTTRRE